MPESNDKMSSIVKMLQYIDGKQPVLKKWREIGRLMNIAIDITNWYNEIVKDGKYQYEKVLDSIKAYLKKEGKILPVNDMAFLYWFFEIQHPDLKVGQPLPTIEQEDFLRFHAYRDEQLKALINNTPQTIEATVEEVPTFIDTAKKDDSISFDELFLNPDEAEPCVNVLKIVAPPIIDSNLNYILGDRRKSVIAVWIKVLKDKGKIRVINDKQLAELLNRKFGNLNIGADGKTFRSISITAQNKYQKQLLSHIG